MDTNYLTKKIVSGYFLCSILGHHYKLIKKINEHFNEYECSRCKKQATNDNRGKKITLTSELKGINETLFYLRLRREFLTRFYFSRRE